MMNFSGIILGAIALLCIGLFHPLVIKGEYYFGTRCWWFFALLSIGCILASLFVTNIHLSIILGIIACSSLWSIHELFQQKKRVENGWFPKNPNKKIKP